MIGKVYNKIMVHDPVIRSFREDFK
jgi:hypothetical protein